MNKFLKLSAIAILGVAFSACNGTWLRYDVNAPDRVYFKVAGSTNVHSFALVSEDEMEVSYPVYILGTPKNEDREVPAIQLFSDGEQTVVVGNDTIPVMDAVEGTDFQMGKVIIPAGKVQGEVHFTLKRNAGMNGVYRKVCLLLQEDQNFLRMDSDSTNLKSIVTAELVFYVTDGEPACPEWWKTASGGVDYEWGMYYGNYFPAKFRKMLEYYHSIGDKNPLLYDEMLAKYGENIDKEGLPRSFMSSQDQSVWATYVLIPLHAYYMEYYKEHPENAEKFANAGDLTSRTWGDPMRLLR